MQLTNRTGERDGVVSTSSSLDHTVTVSGRDESGWSVASLHEKVKKKLTVAFRCFAPRCGVESDNRPRRRGEEREEDGEETSGEHGVIERMKCCCQVMYTKEGRERQTTP